MQNKCLIFLIVTFLSSTVLASIEFKDILNFQNQDNQQSEFIQNKLSSEHMQNKVSQSEWLLDVRSSLEKRSNYTEVITSRPDNVTTSLPWSTTLKQNTPYGLSFNLEYYKELDSPSFNNFFQDERYRANLEFSLVKDFLGKESRKIKSVNDKATDLFNKKVRVDLCADLSKKFIKASALQEQLILTEKALKESEEALAKIYRAFKKGALHKSSYDSTSLDVSSLRSERILLRKNLEDALVDLEQSSGFSLVGEKLVYLREPKYSVDSSSFYLESSLLDFESQKMDAQRARLKINNGQDVSLYGGYESSRFSQNTINVEGESKFNFVGLQAQLKFGNSAYKDESQRLKAMASIKKTEAARSLKALERKNKTLLISLKTSQESYKEMKSGLAKGERIEKKAYKNFYNGKIRYFDFFSARNQVLSFKKAVVDAKSNFWNMYIDYLSLKGNDSKLCKDGGGL